MILGDIRVGWPVADGEPAGRHRAVPVIALSLVAFHGSQGLPLLVGFRALGDPLEAQGLAEGRDGGCNGLVVGVVDQIANKGLVESP